MVLQLCVFLYNSNLFVICFAHVQEIELKNLVGPLLQLLPSINHVNMIGELINRHNETKYAPKNINIPYPTTVILLKPAIVSLKLTYMYIVHIYSVHL